MKTNYLIEMDRETAVRYLSFEYGFKEANKIMRANTENAIRVGAVFSDRTPYQNAVNTLDRVKEIAAYQAGRIGKGIGVCSHYFVCFLKTIF
ncbi:MAG TPA: hypothetical protein ENH82_14630, partial [bacterium]|nr:hypothetical protein [bacterium]